MSRPHVLQLLLVRPKAFVERDRRRDELARPAAVSGPLRVPVRQKGIDKALDKACESERAVAIVLSRMSPSARSPSAPRRSP